MLRPRYTFAVLYLLGAVSTLALEVVWARLMALAMGSAVEAIACVLAAFMGGLGAGAWVGSEWGDRIRRPAGTFAVLQLVGALAATLPYLVFLLPAKAAFFFGLISVALASFPLGVLFPLASRVREEDGTGRGSPRWSVLRVQLMAGTASMAGLPGSRAWVWGACPDPVEGPLSARGPSMRSPEYAGWQLPSAIRLLLFAPSEPLISF